ncbi:MAG: VWA domain-containing protein [Kineosporiaceae bacterium]|nr:VWA domain-containing protein [Kineosporiaceae bacterium]MBK7623111.1 VWA domain-containing protein [Kineosporiaceae bacterium]MBK8074938.1 VWA domain-containing protein [Kineosporiaceae bacterium]
MSSPTAADELLGAFARAARAAGLPVTPDRTRAFLTAAAAVGVMNRDGVYWAGRSTLTAEPDHLELYDRVFEAWFDGEAPRLTGQRRAVPPKPLAGLTDTASGDGTTERDPAEVEVVRARASDLDLLRHRDVADLTPGEKAMLAQLFAVLRPSAPPRRAVRRRPFHRGEVDLRRTLRAELRRGGEAGPILMRRKASRPRRVVLLIDISGSMDAYADALLRLAHVWLRAVPRQVEVFTIGTRLTRVTRSLRARDAEHALKAAGEEVPDWSGGTRLGEVLQSFLDRWGQRGMARGAVVVIFSDGWERGDVGLLAEQTARLRRLAHRVVWVNPHRGKAGYRPVQGGIVAALPNIDDLLAGHSLATFAELVEVVRRA